uniref:N-acetylgalactosaminide beta-1,3-galactosyltransferase n=1 Tax=Periophthalmus magnuspinnatus TaxID=409849 RepID=A0A3B3ZZJ7_9GOBI
MRLRSRLTFASGLVIGFMTLHVLLDWDLHTLQHVSKEDTTRILCWIMTSPKNLQSRTVHARETWAKRCDVTLYMSSTETAFPTVALNVSEGRENLYWKTIRAFQYIHDKHLDQADWFFKADDDTFVVVENLHLILSSFNPEEPYYLGRRFSPFVKQGYFSKSVSRSLSCVTICSLSPALCCVRAAYTPSTVSSVIHAPLSHPTI